MKKYDVVALGELLIDFTQNGESIQGNRLFEANPGGAPCNVLAMLCKFNKRTAFIGKVGNDPFGNLLEDTLLEIGINTDGLVKDQCTPTTLAFVHNFSNGDREFSFYRKPGADMMLSEEDLNVGLISNAKIFHFGTLSMTHPNTRKATKEAVSIAKKNGALISFDPNIRESLWDSLDEAYDQVSYGLSQCDILKISDNELKWYTKKSELYRRNIRNS
jgi:fructokinase